MLLVDALREHKAQQAEQRRYVANYQDNEAVVCQNNGAWLNAASLSSLFRRYIRKTPIRVRFHDLRHSHVTILMGLNIHAKVASERAGHSTIGITMNTYSHVLPEMQQDVALKLEKLFRDRIAARNATSATQKSVSPNPDGADVTPPAQPKTARR